MPAGAEAAGIAERPQLVDAAEIDVARHEDLDAIAIALDDRGRDVERALQGLRADTFDPGRVDDRGPPAPRSGFHRRLHCPVDGGDQDGGAEPVPEVPVHLALQPGAAERVGSGGFQRYQYAGGRSCLGPDHEYPGAALLHLPPGLSHQLGAALEQHHLAIHAKGIGRRHAGGHAR